MESTGQSQIWWRGQAGRDAEQMQPLLWKHSPSREQTSGVRASHPEKSSVIDPNTVLFTTEGCRRAAWRQLQLSALLSCSYYNQVSSGEYRFYLEDEVGQ